MNKGDVFALLVYAPLIALFGLGAGLLTERLDRWQKRGLSRRHGIRLALLENARRLAQQAAENDSETPDKYQTNTPQMPDRGTNGR